MKTYKLNGIEYYTVAFNKKDAMCTYLLNSIGVTTDDIIETDIEPNRDAIGKVFTSLEELNDFTLD